MSRYEGKVFYNKSDIMHISSFQNLSGTINKQDERTRFAYIVISKKEAKDIAGSLKDDKKVLDSVKSKY